MGLPQIFNLWEEEEVRLLYTKRVLLVATSHFRRSEGVRKNASAGEPLPRWVYTLSEWLIRANYSPTKLNAIRMASFFHDVTVNPFYSAAIYLLSVCSRLLATIMCNYRFFGYDASPCLWLNTANISSRFWENPVHWSCPRCWRKQSCDIENNISFLSYLNEEKWGYAGTSNSYGFPSGS